MKKTIIIAIVILFSLILWMPQEARAGCYELMMSMAKTMVAEFSSGEKELDMFCGISKEICKKRIALARNGISLAREGVKILKKESSCKEYSDFESDLKAYEKYIEDHEKIVNKYDLMCQ